MGWFGGGDSSSSSSSGTQAKDFSSVDETGFSGGSNIMSSPGPSEPGMGASNAAAAEMQQFAMALQQQKLVQQAITTICDVAFEKCITGKPNDSLSSSQAVCIASTTNKWLDTNEFMIGRLAKKQEAQQQQQHFS